jgi:hypothetical protein
MRAVRLSSGITPWDEWYHAMALAKLDLGGRAACGRRSAVLCVVSQDRKIGIDPGGRIAAFVPRLLRSHRNEENPSIGSAAMSLRLPDR